MKISNRLAALALLSLVGCAAPAVNLTPSAERVLVSNAVPTDASYEMVGEVGAHYGANFRSQDVNIDLCRAKLKRDADQLGAEVVVLTTQSIGAGECRNCVSMRGNAYRRKATTAAQ
jgi:hypothetical protein